MKVIRGATTAEGWVPNRYGDPIGVVLSSLETVIYDSEDYNTGNTDMSKVRITIEVLED